MSEGFKTVTKDQFFDFINGRQTVVTTCRIKEPPVKSVWENNVLIAYIIMEWLGPNRQTSTGDDFYEYRIKADV